MDASRGTAGQRAGSRRTSSASSMEFSSNTGTCFRTRLRKRNPGAVYPCSAAVSPSDEHHEVAHSTVAAAAGLTTPLAASAQSLTETQPRAVIAPWLTDERLKPNHPSAPRRARSGARLATRTRSTSRPTAVWSRPTKAPFKRRSCSALRLAKWAGPDASELEPTRRDQGHARIALHADPLASEGRGDPADRSRAGEGIEDGPALLAAFKRRPDHGFRDRVPNAVGVGARQRQHPAQRGSARSHDLTLLPEAQEIVHAVVPALAGACLGPEAARLKTPAGTTEPADDECVHAHPLGAVVAIADHHPQVAVGREDALPFTPEAHGQVVRVTFGRRTPPPSHPVRRRGQDHPDAPRRDLMEAVTVPAEQAQPPIAALVAGHGEATLTGRHVRAGCRQRLVVVSRED